MNLLLSDMPLPQGLVEKEGNIYIDLSALKIHNCIGCFGCWTKTPGCCVIRDDAVKVYPLIAKSQKVIYASRVYCGSYDTVMKTMLERAIPIQKAFIRLYHGETHHVQRAVVPKKAVIIAYGAKNEEEKEIFRRLVARNAHNMLFSEWRIKFISEEDRARAIQEEVAEWEN